MLKNLYFKVSLFFLFEYIRVVTYKKIVELFTRDCDGDFFEELFMK
jgi:hypothetical protein